MTVVVYEHPLSPYAQKVKIALIEKGVDFDARLPAGIGSGETEAEFAAASPRGEVPAFVEGEDVRLFDSSVILEYIEERWPKPPMLPKDAVERARVRMLEDAMDTHFEAITWGLSELRHFGRGEPAQAETMFEAGLKQLDRWYAWLDEQLGERYWFNGASFGWGDLCVAPFVNGAIGFGAQPKGDAGGLGRARE